jgi:CubicO group peptidase (beta-lactamase class C family)
VKPFATSMSRRTVVKGAGGGVATAAIGGRAVPVGAIAQDPPLPDDPGTGWTHLVGGGGSLFFYNEDTGEGLTGTLDNTGWHAVERYTDFKTGWNLVTCTSEGSVLLVDSTTGEGASGVLADGRWSYLVDYDDFTTGWTHLVATGDSALFYTAGTGEASSGTLVDGVWEWTTDYDDFFSGYTHLTASDDTVLLYAEGIGFGASGTLVNGSWEWVGVYDDFAPGWTLQGGAGDSLLLLEQGSGTGASGYLRNGAWEYTTDYTDFSPDWTHVAASGNDDFVLFYDANSGLPAWGTLAGGVWEYYGIAVASDSGNIDAVDELARAFLAETGVPGMSFAVAKDGNLVYARGYGVTEWGTDDPVTVDSRFRIASVSKPITSAAIMTLVESGQLSLDDTVLGADGLFGGRYVPNPYTPAYADISITHLLQHTAGAWSNAAPDPMYEEPELGVEDLIDWVIDNHLLEDPPGTQYAYSNFGYCLLGRVIEHVTGQDYADYVQAAVLDPCGITSMQIAGNTLAERAPDEVVYDDGNTPANFGRPYEIPVSRMDAHGGWIATATDLLRFVVRVDQFGSPPDILQDATITTMTTPSAANPIDADPGYAMGWNINAANTWWHDGELAGSTAFLVRASDGICWAAIANGNGINFDTVGWELIRKVETWPTGVPL